MKTIRLLFGISVFWLSLSMLFDGINTLVLPGLLLLDVPEERKATALGLLTFFGLLLGMLIQPITGSISDRLQSRWGRKSVIGFGVLLSLLSLAVLGGFTGLVFTVFGYILLQVSASVAQSAQQGFIPDLVSPTLRGRAAGIKSFMDIAGAMLGFVLLGQVLGAGQISLAVMLVGGSLVLGFLLTVLLVREPKYAYAVDQPHPFVEGSPFRLNLKQHHAFFWLIVSRFLFLLGTYAVGRFLLFFIADRLALPAAEASEQAGNLLALLALITVLASIPAGWSADHFGRKPVMVFGSLVSALGTFLLMFANSFPLMLLFGALMSLGSAAFASANWAMTADLSPPNQAGRFFGLANIGTAGAAAAAGLFGPLVDYGNSAAPDQGYIYLFSLAAIAAIASALSLQNVRSATMRFNADLVVSENEKLFSQNKETYDESIFPNQEK